MNRRFYIGLLALAALALILAACSSSAEPTPSAPPAQTAEVVQQEEQESVLDTAWTVLAFGDADEAIPSVPDSFPSVDFMGERYTGYTGCNFFLGVYGVDGSTLGMNTPAVTKGVCENALLFQQEDMFLAALTATSRYEIDGDNLILYVIDDQAMILEPLESVPFEGTIWNYKFRMTDQTVWLPIIPSTTVTAQFEGDRITGFAGCNDYTGTVTRDGNQMTIGDISVTEKACSEPDGVMEQEQTYLELLQTTGSIRQYARSFELFDTDKQPLMLFNAD